MPLLVPLKWPISETESLLVSNAEIRADAAAVVPCRELPGSKEIGGRTFGLEPHTSSKRKKKGHFFSNTTILPYWWNISFAINREI